MLSVPENNRCKMTVEIGPFKWDEEAFGWPSGDQKPFETYLDLKPGAVDIATVWPVQIAEAIASDRPVALRVPDAEGMCYLVLDTEFSSYLSKDVDSELCIGIRQFATDLLEDMSNNKDAWCRACVDEQDADPSGPRRREIDKALNGLAKALGFNETMKALGVPFEI